MSKHDGQDQPAEPPGPLDPRVGRCSACRHARVLESAKGAHFWQCRAADRDERLMRYPPLPVRSCFAFEAGTPSGGQSDAGT